jgi:hypothetical protein
MNPDAAGTEDERAQRILFLMEQEQETSLDFMNRVRGRIQRRTAVSHVASYTWHLPKTILLELVSLLGHLFKALGTQKES